MVSYSYDSWGSLISTNGSLSNTIGAQNHSTIAATTTAKQVSTPRKAGSIPLKFGSVKNVDKSIVPGHIHSITNYFSYESLYSCLN